MLETGQGTDYIIEENEDGIQELKVADFDGSQLFFRDKFFFFLYDVLMNETERR